MIINKRQWIHRITAVLLIVMTGMAATVQMTSAAENSSAKKSENTSTSLKEAQQEKAALEKALEKAKQTINELKESKGDVQAKVNDLNTQLMNISSRITALENQLAQKNQELTEKKDQIEDTKDQLEDAKKQEEQQYTDMKVRIQFMYENAQESYFEALFDSESFSDFLNSAEYIIQIQEYDRKKLKEYQDTRSIITGHTRTARTRPGKHTSGIMVILFTGSSLLCLNAPDLGNDLLLRLNLRSIIIRVALCRINVSLNSGKFRLPLLHKRCN